MEAAQDLCAVLHRVVPSQGPTPSQTRPSAGLYLCELSCPCKSQSHEWAQGLQVPQSLLCPTPMEGEARKRALHALLKSPPQIHVLWGMSLGLPVLANIHHVRHLQGIWLFNQ